MKAQTVAKKHVTPKWVDCLLIGILVLMPVLYVAGFNVNYGPSMSYLGWFYRTSWGEQPTRVGQIIRFAQPGQPTWRKYLLPSIKRVAEIRKDGYFVEGDNTEHSQDSRDWGKDIPHDHVAGIVVWCWSPARALRSGTAEGRFLNRISFQYSPHDLLSSVSGEVAVLRLGSTELFDPEGSLIRTFSGCTPRKWNGSVLILAHELGQNPPRFEYLSFDVKTRETATRLDRNGRRVVANPFPMRRDGYLSSGGICYALDDDPRTAWVVSSASPGVSVSRISFDSPRYIKQICVRGFADATVQLRIKIDGRVVGEAVALQLVEFSQKVERRCGEIQLEFERLPVSAEEFEGQIDKFWFE